MLNEKDDDNEDSSNAADNVSAVDEDVDTMLQDAGTCVSAIVSFALCKLGVEASVKDLNASHDTSSSDVCPRRSVLCTVNVIRNDDEVDEGSDPAYAAISMMTFDLVVVVDVTEPRGIALI